MDYANGKIYKLVSNVIPDIYIGSTTTELKKRKHYHKMHYESWQKKLRGYITSFKLFEAGDVEIVLIENFPCSSKDELFARERFWIENTICVNKFIPGRTKAEYNEQYYGQNKDKILEKVICENCSKEGLKHNLPRHQKTKKCLSLKSQPKIDKGIF